MQEARLLKKMECLSFEAMQYHELLSKSSSDEFFNKLERGTTGLAPKRLDALGTAMLAITNQCVDLGIGDPAVCALRIGTGQ